VATEPGAASCPVCGEAFREAPARCFRCESDLELWWPLDASLRALEGETLEVAAAPRSGPVSRQLRRWAGRNAGWLVPAFLMTGLAGALWLSLESTRQPVAPMPLAVPTVRPSVRPASAPAPAPVPARTIRYVVQPGDSLWRIAAALKGDARRWPELLAKAGDVDPARLRPGQELLLIVEGRWRLLQTVTAFTLAHSITLAAATLGHAEVPAAPVEAAIALSILFLGPEIVRRWRGESSFTIRHPWVVAFAFGLLHGFGFAGALLSVGLPQRELPLALVSFNLGVELGQLGFIAALFSLERAIQALGVQPPRWVRLLPGYAVGSLGAFWTLQRLAPILAGAR
jgi:hypothetical protein